MAGMWFRILALVSLLLVPLAGQDGYRTPPDAIARAALAGPPPATVLLRIEGRGRAYTFSFATRPGEWTPLSDGEDGSILSTATAGGFVGTYLGLYARTEPSE